MHPKAVAVHADDEVAGTLRILTGEQHPDEAADHREHRTDGEHGQDQVVRDGQQPLVKRLPAVEVVGVAQVQGRMGFGAVIAGSGLEVERRVVLMQEQGVAQGPPLVAVGHGDHVEDDRRNALGKQHRDQADQGKDAA